MGPDGLVLSGKSARFFSSLRRSQIGAGGSSWTTRRTRIFRPVLIPHMTGCPGGYKYQLKETYRVAIEIKPAKTRVGCHA